MDIFLNLTSKKKYRVLGVSCLQQPVQDMNCDVDGIFPPVAGILGSLQANEVLKTILNLKDDLNGNILIFESLKMNIKNLKYRLIQNAKIYAKINYLFNNFF